MFSLKWSDIDAGIKLGLFVIDAIKKRRAERKLEVVDEAGQPIAISPEEFSAKIDALHAKADQVADGIVGRIEDRHKDDPIG